MNPFFTNVSSFELLVKPIITSPSAPNRTIIQGYFLTISNASLFDVKLTLGFSATDPGLLSSPVVAFWDVNGTNQEIIQVPFRSSFDIELPASDTGLFLLQPDVRNPDVVKARNTEIRGRVVASIRSVTPPSIFPNPPETLELLFSPTQRGTFFPQGSNTPPTFGDYDQLAYSLPTNFEVTFNTKNLRIVPPITSPVEPRFIEAIRTNPSLLATISNDPLAQQLANMVDVEEQRRMVDIFLERFERPALQEKLAVNGDSKIVHDQPVVNA
ncbi:MAG: hypothetical protein KME15_25760 [Drouetiella hepatica Uher 2000/2452]|jgi:hypothetical protein|uniref:Uncharacterized protein n=1 Tax=Drouetiella hepatica Uher 2000/2452 TaxID=904376 RepID=A0A951US20_9CYAN|nr:hypothetical protein [Drouetiella hepatica Uher 2000/2452]